MEFTYRIDQLEAIARKVLKGYDPALLFGLPAAVPIEKIAEWLGLNIEYQCLRKNGLILGETVYDKTFLPVFNIDKNRYELIFVNDNTILLDESLLDSRYEGRLRFTCAHELAHWLLHKDLFTGMRQIAAQGNLRKSSEEHPIAERQADYLATALLMPTGQVKRAFHAVRDTPKPITTLAALFEVSKQTMSIFLKGHGLL
jgi:Zn-dependent peptidase ImmA (M78 family)